MATLEVVGPQDRDEARPLGDYCDECWKRIAVVLDAIEEMGRKG